MNELIQAKLADLRRSLTSESRDCVAMKTARDEDGLLVFDSEQRDSLRCVEDLIDEARKILFDLQK